MLLYRLDVRQQRGLGQHDVGVLEAGQLIHRFDPLLGPGLGLARVDAVAQPRGWGLARETIGHGLHGRGLVGLLFELDLHRALGFLS